MKAQELSDARRREAQAKRDRIRRDRRRNGLRVVDVEIHEDEIDVLVERRRLSEWDDRNYEAIGRAIGRLVSDYCGATRGEDD